MFLRLLAVTTVGCVVGGVLELVFNVEAPQVYFFIGYTTGTIAFALAGE